jgi:hypothetical protein
MKTSSFKIVMVFIITLIIGSQLGAEDKKDRLIDELYIESGFEAQIKNQPEAFKLNLDEQTSLIDKSQDLIKEYFENANSMLYKSFDSSVLEVGIKSDLKKQLSIKEINYILDFLKTPLGIKATKLEVRTSSSESIIDFKNYLMNLSVNPVPESRIPQLKKFEELVHTLDFTTEMTINTQLAMTAAITYSFSAENTLNLTEVKKKLDQSKPQIKSALQPIIIPFLHFTYKDLSDNELKQYIIFYEHNTSQHFIKVVSNSYLKAITRGTFNFGESIADFVKNREKQKET